jgi:hypothetical protein
MKRILSLALTLFCATSFGATLNPISLLNPAGSTSGQAIVSTGPTTAPAWTTITPAAIGGLKASNNLSDVASATAALTNLGGLSTTAAASTYATITNLALKAPLASPTFTGTATIPTANIAAGVVNGTSIGATTPFTGAFTTLSATGLISPASTIGIKGTATNDNVQSASVGEYLESFTLATPLTTGTLTNLASISLTAGDWDVTGIASFIPAASTVTVVTLAGINTVSATTKVISGGFVNIAEIWPAQNTPVGTMNLTAPVTRISLAATTTVYLVGQANFSTSTMTANGYVRARRVR